MFEWGWDSTKCFGEIRLIFDITTKLFKNKITNEIVYASQQNLSIFLWIFQKALPLSRSSPMAFLCLSFKKSQSWYFFFLNSIYSKHVNISRGGSSHGLFINCMFIAKIAYFEIAYIIIVFKFHYSSQFSIIDETDFFLSV